MTYQIKMVAEMLGIPKNTLIAWERRYAIVQPERTASGYRTYSDDDLATLRRVQALLEQGYKASEACRIVIEQNVYVLGSPAKADAEDVDAAEWASLRASLLACLMAFDRDGADRVVARFEGSPFEVRIDEVYAPMLHEVGRGWQTGTYTVVQEHFASAYCRERLLWMLQHVRVTSAVAPVIVCATPPDEHHELGLLVLAIRLALRGFHVQYLGVNVPTDQLVDHVNAHRPAALCLSMVNTRPPDAIVRYMTQLRRSLDEGVRIAVGGQATSQHSLEVDGVSFYGHGMPEWIDGLPRSTEERG